MSQNYCKNVSAIGRKLEFSSWKILAERRSSRLVIIGTFVEHLSNSTKTSNFTQNPVLYFTDDIFAKNRFEHLRSLEATWKWRSAQ